MYNITEELKATLSFSMWLFICIIEHANSEKIINRTNKKKINKNKIILMRPELISFGS